MALNLRMFAKQPKSEKKSAFEPLSYRYNPELAKSKLLKADEALRQYFDRSKYDAEKEKELMAAVELALRGFVDQFETLFPQI